jgi:hypothetical protein
MFTGIKVVMFLNLGNEQAMLLFRPFLSITVATHSRMHKLQKENGVEHICT